MKTMNKELETIIENEFDCLISELGCLMGDEWKAESIKKVVNQAFSLHAVSQRSELLLMAICEFTKRNTQKDIKEVEDWIEQRFNK
tara:strand:+ start:39 stop:296 length:258 start_codon:yes stop_codon:yes gene_type:complete